MRILITGGAGYIGSHCAKRIAGRGHEVVVLDSLERGHEAAVRWGDFVRADLRDREAVFEAVRSSGAEAVIHFAGLAYVGESMAQPGRYFHTNVTGSQNLLDAMREVGIDRIVFSSSCTTYGEPERMPIAETTPQQPTNPYGQSKLMVEQMLRWYGERHDLRWAVLRYFNVVGTDPDGELGEDHEPETHLVPNAIRAALGSGPPLQVFGDDYPTPDGTPIRDYVHVWDLVEAHRLALDVLATHEAPVVCNLGTGIGTSVKQVIDATEAVVGRPVPRSVGPRRPGDPPELVAEASRARSLLGWTPAYPDLHDAIRHAAAWYERTR